MILSGSATHSKGLDSALWSSRNRLIAAWRSTTDRKTPRLRRRFVRTAKKPSTALSQEAEVGVKWNVQRGWRASHWRTAGCLWSVVVEDRMDRLAGGDFSLDGVGEPDELLMAMAVH